MIDFQKLWNQSAEWYQQYALSHRQYRETNRKLVELADLKPKATVIDLASGTGFTTNAILDAHPDIGAIYDVDFSERMLAAANAHIHSSKVAFILADAADTDKVVPIKADAILCNSSFWQFPDPEKTLTAIANALKPGGVFAFNLNQQFFEFDTPEADQELVMQDIFAEMKKHGFKAAGTMKKKIAEEDLRSLFSKTGFTLVKKEVLDLGERSLDELLDFFRIPATATFFEHVPKETQERILSAVREHLRGTVDTLPHNRWVFFILEKRG
ncbi:MAG: methyltransferase domain-containing protein [Patescibacteria group bacterium]|nr:methyltransferase domain-containing protein [Patescibacteria group bacterium]